MNKKKADIAGLIFSAFLVIAFVVCSYFFLGIIKNSGNLDPTVSGLLESLVYVLFGLVLFYATRVGDGKQIKRFSAATLIILDLPALYIILAAVAKGLPFPLDLAEIPQIVILAAVAFGYGIPYTFLSGYEQDIPAGESKGELPEEYEPDELDEEEAEEGSGEISEEETKEEAEKEADTITEDETEDKKEETEEKEEV